MSKKISLVGTLIFVILLCVSIYSIIKGTFSVEAGNTGRIVIECDKTSVNPSASLTCYIKGKEFNYGVSSFHGVLNVGSNLTITSFTKDTIWEGGNVNNIIDLYTANNKTGNFNIASFVVKASNVNDGFDTNVSLTDVIISNEKFEENEMTVTSLNVRIKSNVNTLSSLTVNSNNILTDLKTYNLAFNDEESVIIGASKTSSNSVLSGDIGTKTLNPGVNKFTIKVTSESGIDNIYTINITKPDLLTFSENIVIKNVNDKLYFIKKSNEKNHNTTSKIKNEIITSGSKTVKNKDNNVFNDNDKVGTGSKLIITLSNEEKEYFVVIPGDVNGDGNITVTDVAKLFQHYQKTKIIPDNEYYYIIGGDVIDDDEIKLTDVAKLFQYISGTISSLN